jgi:alkylhydroperoxidase/carboxymuconolactone decarboxylase family protein YurZ
MAKEHGKGGPLPDLVEKFRASHGAVWESYEALSARCQEAGPLDERTRRLVKLGIAVGARLEGATHSHVRKCLDAGISPAEIEHAVLLALTTVGLPRMMMAYGWVTETLAKEARRRST